MRVSRITINVPVQLDIALDNDGRERPYDCVLVFRYPTEANVARALANLRLTVGDALVDAALRDGELKERK